MRGWRALLGPALPDCWVTATVKDCQNDNAPRLRTEVDAVWKPLRCDAANAFVNHGIELRLLGSERNAPLNFSDELNAEVWALCLIPRSRLNELCAGGTAKRNRKVIAQCGRAPMP